MTEISLRNVRTEERTVRCDVEYDRELRRFFTGEPFVADYDVDLEAVPPSIAVVPALAHVGPVAWANGADIRVPTVDETYLEAFRAVGNELVEMYPEFMRGGRIRVGEAVGNEVAREGAGDAAMLFTGGVDSVATYVRHRAEDPILVSVQGWVVGRDEPERWASVKRQVRAFAEPRGLRTRFVSSNMLDFLDTPMLQAHYKRFVDGAWYSSVGHGLGLLSLCAPLAYAAGIDTLYIASSHTDAFDEPWGSHPRIDDRVRWTGTRAVHDGFELTRQEKLNRIADYVRSEDAELVLRTCIHSSVGENCNDCEKCYRTMVGLLVAGLDPNDHGYEMDRATFGEIRRAFETGRFTIMEHTRFHWEDVQAHLPVEGPFPVPGTAVFLAWLGGVDFDDLTERGGIPLADRVVRAGMRHTPQPVYAGVYSVYDQVRAMTRHR